jgi:phosphatidylserine synthase 2
MIQFRDGPFIRPHPAFWRIILGLNVLWQLSMVFLLFQDLDTARRMMTYIDPSLGRPLPERNYAEDCSFTPHNVWVSLRPLSPHHACRPVLLLILTKINL